MSTGWRADFPAAPPFAPFAGWAERLGGNEWPTLADLNVLADERALTNAAGLPLRFTTQTLRCGQLDYEQSALTDGRLPTRERNWHDLFNALVWLTWPRTKAALNAVQCGELRAGARRSPVSDAATLFDESGMVLVGATDDLVELLRTHRWQEAWVERRAEWAGVCAYVIGHAVLEKLLSPWPGITAKCMHLDIPAQSTVEVVDAALSRTWQASVIKGPSALFPLPVLGMPGWWPANAVPSFYSEARYFRPSCPSG